MDNPANLLLSPEEMRLVSDPGWILTKNSVMGKAIGVMGGLAAPYRECWDVSGLSLGGPSSGGGDFSSGAHVAGAGVAGIDPKVSRGENYRGLPWVMLDYPRVFGREDVLAIRTMFWWGHAFSVTLHLKGSYKRVYLPVIQGEAALLAAAGFHVGISDDEWRHEHTPEVYRPIDGPGDLLGDGDFFKLSAAVGLDRWAEAPELLLRLFQTLVGVLKQG